MSTTVHQWPGLRLLRWSCQECCQRATPDSPTCIMYLTLSRCVFCTSRSHAGRPPRLSRDLTALPRDLTVTPRLVSPLFSPPQVGLAPLVVPVRLQRAIVRHDGGDERVRRRLRLANLLQQQRRRLDRADAQRLRVARRAGGDGRGRGGGVPFGGALVDGEAGRVQRDVGRDVGRRKAPKEASSRTAPGGRLEEVAWPAPWWRRRSARNMERAWL
mmetsp:Transcript_35365/g.118223  ORF Transcript_35365/g.118223 Transcript_35365/m.118223 type:complete len:215 (+) Transcript_35365:77-721(+)